MPTITIETLVLSRPRRRAVSLRLTRWLSNRQTDPSHVIVRFSELAEHSVFSGGMPVEALSAGASELPFASVTCCVGPDRDETFREELAAEIQAALGMAAGTPFLYVEFRPTSPAHVYVSRDGRLRRADSPTADNGKK